MLPIFPLFLVPALGFGIDRPSKPYGLLLKQFVPLGERTPGVPEVFPSLYQKDQKYIVFPEDSAATFEESTNRCRSLGAQLAVLEGADDMEMLGCLLQSPAFVGGWGPNEQPLKSGRCMVLFPGGGLVEADDICNAPRASICKKSDELYLD